MLSFALHSDTLHGHYLRVYLHFVDNDDLEDDEVEDDPDDVADPLYHTEVCTPCALLFHIVSQCGAFSLWLYVAATGDRRTVRARGLRRRWF